jgi:hypothetical protein
VPLHCEVVTTDTASSVSPKTRYRWAPTESACVPLTEIGAGKIDRCTAEGDGDRGGREIFPLREIGSAASLPTCHWSASSSAATSVTEITFHLPSVNVASTRRARGELGIVTTAHLIVSEGPVGF